MEQQGLEVEARILSVLRRRSNYHKYRGIIQGSFFQIEPTRQIFQLIDEFYQEEKVKTKKITAASLKLLVHQKIRNKELLKDCLDITDTLKGYRSKDNPVVEATIKDFSKRQLVRQGVLTALAELDKPTPDFTQVQEHIDKALMIGASNENQFYSYFEDPETRMTMEKREKRISSGIPILDEHVDGGWGAGELVVVLAPPERGKTITMVNFGTAALFQGKTVGYLTLELSERKIARRFDLRITGRPIESLREDPTRVRNPLASLRKTGCDLVIKDYSSENPRLEDIKSFIVTYQNRMKKKFDLLLVDYADLISPTKNFKQERFALKEIYTNLRRLANEFQVPIITASQANRKSVIKRVITMEDFDESFAKAAVADIVLGLCQTPEELEDGLARFFIAKNRSSGSHKLIWLTMKPKIMFMGEYDRLNRREGPTEAKKGASVADRI